MKKLFRRLLKLISLILILSFIMPSVATAVEIQSVQITIPDINLEAAIREVISKPTGAIYDTDMLKIKELDITSEGVCNLAGLQHAKNMERFIAQDNGISDLTPISELYSLTSVNLMINSITDLTPLTELNKLIDLAVNNNLITKLPDQIGNMKQLKVLWLSNNKISDITPLNNLTNLEMLLLECNNITDISPLEGLSSLRTLSVSFNKINNINELANCDNMTQLYMEYCGIVDCTPLSNLKKLRCLDLSNNEITNISPLGMLQQLEELFLKNNMISEDGINTIAQMKKLKYIDLNGTPILTLDELRTAWIQMDRFCGADIAGYFYGSGGLGENVGRLFDPIQIAVEKKRTHIIENIVRPEMSEIEKVLAIHDFLVQSAAYDNTVTTYDLLMRHSASCSGYANAMENLLNTAGIKTKSIGGAGHAWNMVLIDGKYYHIDATWNDNNDTDYNYNYFLLSDNEIQSLRSGPAYDWNHPNSGLRYFKDEQCDSTRFQDLRNVLSKCNISEKNQYAIHNDNIYYIESGELFKMSVNGGDSTLLETACSQVLLNNNVIVFQENANSVFYQFDGNDENKQQVDWLLPISSYPSQCGNVFNCDGTINLFFNTDVIIEDDKLITLTDSTGNNIPISCSVSDNTLSINPNNNLHGLQEYTLMIPMQAVSSVEEFNMNEDYKLYFSTEESIDTMAPSINIESGIYYSPQSLIITAPMGSTVYYTIDGSVPTINSKKYTGVIEIDTSTILRYIVVMSNSTKQSKVYGHDYHIAYYIDSYIYYIDIEKNTILINNRHFSVEMLKNNLLNNPLHIKVYKQNNNEALPGDLMETGMKVNLVINDTVHDELSIVVLGDASGDGLISITDYTLTRLDILGLKNLEGAYRQASDINGDGQISITDYTLMRLDILGLKSIH